MLDGFDETTGQHSACGHWQGAWAKDRYFYPFHKCLEAWQRYATLELLFEQREASADDLAIVADTDEIARCETLTQSYS